MWYAAALRHRRPGYSRLVASAGWAGAVVMLAAATISPVGLSARTLADGRIAPSSRVLTWGSAWSTFNAHPWFGKGVGLAAADVHYLDASGGMESLTDAHNVWLSVLAQQGIAGFAAFVLVVWYSARRPGPLVVDGPPLAILRTGLHLAIVGGFLYASLSGSFESTRHVWVLLGLAAAARSLAAEAISAPVARTAESA
jgi:O-antigen ligase